MEAKAPQNFLQVCAGVITNPRQTFIYAHENNHYPNLYLFFALVGLAGGIDRAAQKISQAENLAINLGLNIIIGLLLGWIGLYIGGFIFSRLARILGGKGNTEGLAKLFAIASVPGFLVMILHIVEIYISIAASNEYGDLTGMSVAAAVVLKVIDFIFGLWSLAMFILALSVGCKFSIGRAIGTVINFIIIIVLIFVIIAFAFGGIEALSNAVISM